LEDSVDFFFGTVAQVEFHHRAQASAALHGERTCVEVDVANEVHVDHAHWAAARALRGKVVDGRNLNSIQEEDVFIRAAAANDEVIAKRRTTTGHTGK